MAILGNYSVNEFLTEYWQQKPLLIRGASEDFNDVVSADELAGMACEEQVESRLIIDKGTIDQSIGQWFVENGPIDEQRFSELPENHWTLLVQSVDQWLPEVRDILSEFDFLPSWRLDDVMVSYATAGGGVGPHFDYYDVFLLQTKGRRRWRLGQKCDQKTTLHHGQPLKLLEEFEQTDDFDLEPGDMLYIPAGIAHWGTSLDDKCMTWSIGFRAPSARELLTVAIELLADHLPEQLRYQDSLESLTGQRGEINSAAKSQLDTLSEVISADMLSDATADALGILSTEPRYHELIEKSSEHDNWTLDRALEKNTQYSRNDASRFAYRVDPKDENISKLYVNGECWTVATHLAKSICSDESDVELLGSKSGRELLLKLLNSGAYLASD